MPRERDHLKSFASEITICNKNHPHPVEYTYLKKVILYAKQFKPNLSLEATEEIENYWIEVAAQRGSVRIKSVLERLTKALAKYRFKNIADINDANDAILLHKHVISQYETSDYLNTIPKNPQHVAADVCADILKSNSSVDKRVDDLISIACTKNSQVAAYFSGEKSIRTSYKARSVKDILLQNPNIKQIGQNPVTLQWFEHKSDLTPVSDTNTGDMDDDCIIKQKSQDSDNKDVKGDVCDECDEIN